jgi:hypothetical protein
MVDKLTVVEDIVYTNPSLLLNFDQYEKLGLLYLPYSVGIEFECDQKSTYNLEVFKNISNIMAVDVDNAEQRYRIPNGINGLICLFDLSLKLKEYSLLNGGIHFHVDFTDNPECITQENVDCHKEWILTELDSWEYGGTYNKRDIAINSRKWVRFNTYGSKTTMEFRMMNQTFEYSMLAKRIIHGCNIARRFKANSNQNVSKIRLNNLLNKLKEELKQEEVLTKNEIEINNIVKKRVVKWQS